MWGGLKTLPTRETLQGLASSLEHMKASVRGSLMDGWTASTEARDGPEGEAGGQSGNVGGGEEGGSGQEDFEDDLMSEELKGGLCFLVIHLLLLSSSLFI